MTSDGAPCFCTIETYPLAKLRAYTSVAQMQLGLRLC